MATVYLAKDLRHRRSVALKLLKQELAAAVGVERFLSEIETTANLQHPHILPLFDSGEAESSLFYTMPYVEGETLRARIEREGPLAVDEAVRIATDVAGALQAAHERGVIHRDVKPSNVLFSHGKALVADFGIARVSQLSDRVRLTQTGSSLGTGGYMSPEQASGDTDVDARADIYSLGCVLFEMLAGRPPYEGQNVVSILVKQATEPVPAVRALRQEVPEFVQRAVSRALAKEPGDRYETAAAFAEALSVPTEPRVADTPEVKTIVVLPFVNRSPDPDNEYFSDGLTDEVISDLAQMSSLRVISRNSSMMLKGTRKDARTLARELGTTHLISGTVRRAGNALRVTADVVDAATDTSIWSEKFSGTMEDVFGIQEEISRQIASALELHLTDSEETTITARPIDDPLAWDCYLRAREIMYSWVPHDQHRAMRLVDDALGVVEDSALLLATKANIHWQQVNVHIVPASEGLEQASELVERALAIDPNSALAIYVRGLVAGMRGQTEVALRDIQRAHRLVPNDSNVLGELYRYATSAGMRTVGTYVDRLEQVDPLNQLTLALRADGWLWGRLEDSPPYARRYFMVAPEDAIMRVYVAWSLGNSGFVDEAVEQLSKVGSAITDNMHGPMALFLRHAFADDADAAMAVMTAELEAAIENEWAWRAVADGYALLGRTEDAIRCVREAVRRGFISYPNLSETGTILENVRAEPEFQALMAEVKPRWEAVSQWEEGLSGKRAI